MGLKLMGMGVKTGKFLWGWVGMGPMSTNVSLCTVSLSLDILVPCCYGTARRNAIT